MNELNWKEERDRKRKTLLLCGYPLVWVNPEGIEFTARMSKWNEGHIVVHAQKQWKNGDYARGHGSSPIVDNSLADFRIALAEATDQAERECTLTYEALCEVAEGAQGDA